MLAWERVATKLQTNPNLTVTENELYTARTL